MFMDCCMSKRLRPKAMKGYEQALCLFIRWVTERYGVKDVEELKEGHSPIEAVYYFYNENYILAASLGLYSTMGRRAGEAAAQDALAK